MAEERSNFTPHTHRAWIPGLILAVGVLITSAGTLYVKHVADDKDQARFHREVREAVDDIRDRIDTYTTLLRGGAGLFAASQEVTPIEFHTYVQRLELSTRYPGIGGIGFSLYIQAHRGPGSDLRHL